MLLFRSTRRVALAGVVGAALLVAGGTARAGAPPADLNADATGLMLRGYDPVAYFTTGQPTPGSAEFQASHGAAVFRFANAGNRDAFVSDPPRYLPAYGGFCAMGTTLEKKLDGDPQVWRIVDDRLYLNVNADVQKRWSEDIAGNIAKAELVWPEIRDVPADVLNAK